MTEETNSNPQSLLDPEQLKMLLEAAADDSLDMLREILALYEEESGHKLAEIRDRQAAAEYEAMGRAAHALAGSSANIGGRQVWLLAKEMENLCRKGDGPAAAALIPQLQEAYQETLLQLSQFVDQLASPER